MNTPATMIHTDCNDADFQPLGSMDHQMFFRDESGVLRNAMVTEQTARNMAKGKSKLLVMKDGKMIVARKLEGMADFKPEGW